VHLAVRVTTHIRQLGSDCSLRAVSYPLAVILKLRLSYLGFAVRVHLAVR
jgi:hypothetical protein